MTVSPSTSGVLADATWVDVSRGCTLIIPIGSLEQHGPHLPLDTDAIIATVAVQAVVESARLHGQEFVAAPPINFGASGEHQSFAGTLSVGHDAVRSVIIELTRSASTWAGHIVYVNGHGGNASTLNSAISQLRKEGHSVTWVPCAFEAATDAHAGHDETSVMLFLQPDRVRVERIARGNTTSLPELMPQLVTGGVAAVSDSGVLGDPTTASAEAGRLLFDSLVHRLIDSLLAQLASPEAPSRTTKDAENGH